jgi:hypothetical protein
MKFIKFVLRLHTNAQSQKRALVLLGLVIGSSCSSLPTLSAPVIRDQFYPRPRSEVWVAALTAVRQQPDVIVNTAEPSSGIITYTTLLNEDELKQVVLLRDLKVAEGAAYTTIFVQDKGQQTAKVHAHTKVRIPEAEILLGSSGTMERKLFTGLNAILGAREDSR